MPKLLPWECWFVPNIYMTCKQWRHFRGVINILFKLFHGKVGYITSPKSCFQNFRFTTVVEVVEYEFFTYYLYYLFDFFSKFLLQ